MTDKGNPCVICYKSICSCKCEKVRMFTDTTFPLTRLNNLMTYGLGRCYASIIIYKSYGDHFIFMIHTPYIDTFLSNIKSHISNYNVKYIKIKSPGEYIEDNQKFIFCIKNKKIKKLVEDHSEIITAEPYNLNRSHLNKFNSMLGIKNKDNKLLVSNNYGVFEEIKIDF